MRKEPESTSEMVNQVLFGEIFTILEENKASNFSLIRLQHDKYEGWIDSRCINILSEKDREMVMHTSFLVSHEVITLLDGSSDENAIIIGCGSILRRSSHNTTRAYGKEFKLPEIPVNDPGMIRENLVKYGLNVVSVPYLWGGRSSFGFDCSGLCQNLYRQVDIEIPRDASVQAEVGHSISFISDAKPGDLAFFDNEEGKIIHVGMILGEGKILHASGRVKIDEIDHQGIFSKEQNRYTHSLRLIKKVVV